MAKIVDPDDLVVSTNIFIDTGAKTVGLTAAGSLVAKDGVSKQAVYSKLVELWTTTAYNKFPFPMYVIGAPRAGMFEWGYDGAAYNGWKPLDDTTRQMFRDGGWSEYAANGDLLRQYVGAISLGSVSSGTQIYYQKETGNGVPIDFTFTDPVNEGRQVYGGPSDGNFDDRAHFKMFTREYQKTYQATALAAIGEIGTGAFKIGMPLSNADDLNVVDNDTNVANNSPFTEIVARYFSASYQRSVDIPGTPRDFGIVIDVGTHSGRDGVSNGTTTFTTAEGGIAGTIYDGGTLTIHEGTDAGVHAVTSASGTSVTLGSALTGSQSTLSFTLQRATPVTASLQQIYTKIQYLLRQNTNINTVAGTVTGKVADQTLTYGAKLNAGILAPSNLNGGGSGVFVEGLDVNTINSIIFYDNSATTREYPFVAAGNLNFNSFLTEGGTGYFRMYFTSLPGAGDDYGESGAVTVQDNTTADIAGTITGTPIAFSFAYATNAQGGRTPNTPAPVTIVAGNAGEAKPVVATHTITATAGQSITLTAEKDLGYSNP